MFLGVYYWYNRNSLQNGSLNSYGVNTKKLRDIKAWGLPYRNNKFTGRDGILKKIKNNLDKSNIGIITQPISGIGGIGKTQLATEYSYRSIENRRYDIILWIAAESKNSINSSYSTFASKLNINSQGLQPEQLRKNIYNKLLNEFQVNKILFVFDNVPQEKNIQQYLTELHEQFPINTKLHVLVTSRSQHWTEDVLILNIFTEQEAKNFIKKHLPNENKEDILKLIKALHYFPLALGQALGYIKQHTNIADYLQLYESNKLQLLNILPKDNNQYLKSLWQTTIIALDKLSDQSKRILYISSYLEPDNIQLELFSDVPIATKSSAIQELRKYSFIVLTNNGKSFKVHRLLQEVIRLIIKDNPKWINETIRMANNDKDLFSIKNEESWSKARKWLSHTTILSQHMQPNLEKANFLYDYGEIATYVGLYDLAIEYYKSALKIKETYYQNHIEIADILNKMGQLETSLQNHQKAKKLLERALRMKQSYYQNSHHVEMSNILHNLGRVEIGIGNYKEARKLLQQALKIKKSYRQDNDDVDLANILESIGRLEILSGNQVVAKTILERALKIKEAYYQKTEHIGLINTLNQLGIVECTLGNFEKAKEIFQQTLRMVEGYYKDSSHINVGNMLVNLGVADFYLGNYVEAERLFQQSLEIIKIYYRDPLHIAFVLPLYHSGLTAESLGNYNIALKDLSQSYDIQKKYYQDRRIKAMAYIYAPGSVWPILSSHNQEMAVEYYQKILMIEQDFFRDKPAKHNFAVRYYLLGQAYEVNSNIKLAIVHYENSLHLAIEVDKNIENEDIRQQHQKNIISIKNKLNKLKLSNIDNNILNSNYKNIKND
ncbi:MAG: tetratricopeptide repeat protein [Legionellales bacterium]|nr:tetratricopeptide repeat protein [Legionellales bacterium]